MILCSLLLAAASASPAGPAATTTHGKIFRAVRPMGSPRISPVVAALPGGRLLVAGGGVWLSKKPTKNLAILATASAYHQGLDRWEDIASMPKPLMSSAAGLMDNGKALVAGGTSIGNDTVYVIENVVFVYDPATDTWSDAAPLKEKRSDSAGGSLGNGKFLVSGGFGEMKDPRMPLWASLASAVPLWAALASAEMYDPATNTWTDIAPMNYGRSGLAGGMLSVGKFLVAGGMATMAPETAEVYDVATNSWSLIASLNNHRRSGGIGGLLQTGVFMVASGTELPREPGAEVYDSVHDRYWKVLGDLSTPRVLAGGAVLTSGAFMVVGGFGTFGHDILPLASAEIFCEDGNYPDCITFAPTAAPTAAPTPASTPAPTASPSVAPTSDGEGSRRGRAMFAHGLIVGIAWVVAAIVVAAAGIAVWRVVKRCRAGRVEADPEAGAAYEPIN